MNKKLSVILLMFVLMFAGCKEKQPCVQEDAGELISVKVIPTTWNESIKSSVVTTDYTFIIYGCVSARLGSTVYMCRGHNRVTIGSKQFRIY
jgi:hypothetical protein